MLKLQKTLTALVLMTVATTAMSTSAMAGGGGCDGPCDPNPDELQVVCQIVDAQIDPNALNVEPIPAQRVTEGLKAGSSIEFRGSLDYLYRAVIQQQNGKMIQSFDPYSSPQYAFNHYPLHLPTRQFYQKLLWSYSSSDPSPKVDGLLFSLAASGQDGDGQFALTMTQKIRLPKQPKLADQFVGKASLRCQTKH